MGEGEVGRIFFVFDEFFYNVVEEICNMNYEEVNDFGG